MLADLFGTLTGLLSIGVILFIIFMAIGLAVWFVKKAAAPPGTE
mgnify:FL=1